MCVSAHVCEQKGEVNGSLLMLNFKRCLYLARKSTMYKI